MKARYSIDSRTEKRLMGFSFLMMAICAWLLLDEGSFQRLFAGSTSEDQSSAAIGAVTAKKNDIRFRRASQIGWGKVKEDHSIKAGDSVFTGQASGVSVTMTEGTRLDLGENSLIRFTNQNEIVIPDLTQGNFNLQVKGKMQVMINGEKTEIVGTDSTVQVFLEKGKKPVLRLLKGAANVKVGSKKTELKLGEVTFAPKAIPDPPAPTRAIATAPPEETSQQPSPPPIEAQSPEPRLALQDAPSDLNYRWQIYDWYTQKNNQWARKAKPSDVVSKKIDWQLTTEPSNNFEVSIHPRDSSQRPIFRQRFSSKTFATQAVTLGLNQLKISEPNSSATLLHHFSVTPQFVENATPIVTIEKSIPQLTKENPKVFVPITIQGKLSTYFVETSRSPEFPANTTKVFWTTNQKSEVLIAEPGYYFLRVRGVTPQGHLTDVSKQQAFEVIETVAQPPLALQPVPKPNTNTLTPAPLKAPPPRSPGNEVTTSTATFDPDTLLPSYINHRFKESKVQIEGSAFTMFSTEQVNQQQANPTAMLFGVRGLKWYGSHGFEGYFRSHFGDIGKSEASGKPFLVEGRYKYRFLPYFSPFSRKEQSEISLITGFEYYRNPGTASFTKGYELLKLGAGFNFPMASRWDTGGELLTGLGTNKSQKYEISGFLNYYFNLAFSMGVGYRVHLFETQNLDLAPSGFTPYREGFGEGYSVIRWHY